MVDPNTAFLSSWKFWIDPKSMRGCVVHSSLIPHLLDFVNAFRAIKFLHIQTNHVICWHFPLTHCTRLPWIELHPWQEEPSSIPDKNLIRRWSSTILLSHLWARLGLTSMIEIICVSSGTSTMYVDRISINVFKEHINLLKNKLARRIETHYLAIMCLLISN